MELASFIAWSYWLHYFTFSWLYYTCVLQGASPWCVLPHAQMCFLLRASPVYFILLCFSMRCCVSPCGVAVLLFSTVLHVSVSPFYCVFSLSVSFALFQWFFVFRCFMRSLCFAVHCCFYGFSSASLCHAVLFAVLPKHWGTAKHGESRRITAKHEEAHRNTKKHIETQKNMKHIETRRSTAKLHAGKKTQQTEKHNSKTRRSTDMTPSRTDRVCNDIHMKKHCGNQTGWQQNAHT